ncbi:surface-adhesin E family protein [Brevundimonas sp. TWP2-3-4b2]|uniref:surface-adhesin E family protein n=1 Tax=Brevundimonas sp. TWP2-3-4b2 TaxID=2804595 RepID=UPI003CF78341
MKPGPTPTRFWVRFEKRTPIETGMISAAILSEYDCAGGRVRTIQSTYYNQPNLDGPSTTSHEIRDWSYPLPDSVSETQFLWACR